MLVKPTTAWGPSAVTWRYSTWQVGQVQSLLPEHWLPLCQTVACVSFPWVFLSLEESEFDKRSCQLSLSLLLAGLNSSIAGLPVSLSLTSSDRYEIDTALGSSQPWEWGKWGMERGDKDDCIVRALAEQGATTKPCQYLRQQWNPHEQTRFYWAAVYGVAQSRTRLKRLSSSSSRIQSFTRIISFNVHWQLSFYKWGNDIWNK